MESKKATIDAFRFGFGLPGVAHGFGAVDTMMQQLAAAQPVPDTLGKIDSKRRLIEEAAQDEKVRAAPDSELREQKEVRKQARRRYYESDCRNRLAVAFESAYP